MGSSQRMRPQPQKTSGLWTTSQAYTLGVVCLAAGLAIGYLLRGSDAFTPGSSSSSTSQSSAPASSSSADFPMPGAGLSNGAQAAEAVDKAAAPMIAQLQANPNDASMATRIGNLYDDAKMYPKAIEYYEKSVKLNPQSADVLTDLGTAYFYNGNPDQALTDFNRALKVRPNYPQTLFNMGIVKWQGKNDIKGAVAAWNQLLQTNPNYPEKQKVQELLAQAKQQGVQ
ncbi:MAG TPA: tetratricopeptide repeat protein [Terriglobales bacterium]|nr:tetratricopeptide repeat protein [Terriglobales bacterium]